MMHFHAMAALALAGLVLVAGGCGQAARPDIRTETIHYQQGGKEMVGYLAYDAAQAGKRPGVLVIHEWWGLNDFARQQARQLAEAGYVAFAADMYGGGQTADTPEAAAKLAGQVRGKDLMRQRGLAALKVLRNQPQVDPEKLGAIGFCFGGTGVLELARAGADVDGVVSFHGGLATDKPAKKGEVLARVLVLHGAADTHVPPKDVIAFGEEMESAGVDWMMVVYGHAKHSFTNPASSARNMPGVGYQKEAAERSMRQMHMFFREIFHGDERHKR